MGFNSGFKGLKGIVALLEGMGKFKQIDPRPRRSKLRFLVTVRNFSSFENQGQGQAVAQLVEALRYEPEGRGFDSR